MQFRHRGAGHGTLRGKVDLVPTRQRQAGARLVHAGIGPQRPFTGQLRCCVLLRAQINSTEAEPRLGVIRIRSDDAGIDIAAVNQAIMRRQ